MGSRNSCFLKLPPTDCRSSVSIKEITSICTEITLDPASLHYKHLVKWILDLHVRAATITLLEENTGKSLYDSGLAKTQKSQTIKSLIFKRSC